MRSLRGSLGDVDVPAQAAPQASRSVSGVGEKLPPKCIGEGVPSPRITAAPGKMTGPLKGALSKQPMWKRSVQRSQVATRRDCGEGRLRPVHPKKGWAERLASGVRKSVDGDEEGQPFANQCTRKSSIHVGGQALGYGQADVEK